MSCLLNVPLSTGIWERMEEAEFQESRVYAAFERDYEKVGIDSADKWMEMRNTKPLWNDSIIIEMLNVKFV